MAEVLWSPKSDARSPGALKRFWADIQRMHPERGLSSYSELHRFSIDETAAFWRSLLRFSEIDYRGDDATVLEPGGSTPGGRFFPTLELNFAQNLLRHRGEKIALVSLSEARERRQLSYEELRTSVGRVATAMRAMGLQPGDRVAGYLPNTDEAVIAMLAATSLGALWSSCSPDFGAQGVLDRFGQIAPRLLFATNGYRYNGKDFDCLENLERIAEAIPAIETIVLVPYLADHDEGLARLGNKAVAWSEFLGKTDEPLRFEPLPFNHPLYILYSSGTTGRPKCIVHGAGGTLLQHFKELSLHTDLRPDDTIFYFTTCGWMMWNWLVSSLFIGATVVLYEGSPSFPDLSRLWRLVDEEGITHFGTSPKFIGACRDALVPKGIATLQSLRVLLSTGAPLLPEDFDWIYASAKTDVQLSSISGGTDLISCFMLGNPLLPVVRGEIQCMGLGMDVAAYDEHDQAVVRRKGELVCRKPFVSMPIYFWNDPEHARYRKAYFKRGDETWFHGDYIEITESQGSAGGIIVYGRSDATLNPGGVRIGTAEIYRLVETLPEIADSIVIAQPHRGDVRVVLFVQPAPDRHLDAALAQKIRATVRQGASPRHVPAKILEVGAIPYTISGKKVEIAVRQIVLGEEPINKDALKNPEALDEYRNRPELRDD